MTLANCIYNHRRHLQVASASTCPSFSRRHPSTRVVVVVAMGGVCTFDTLVFVDARAIEPLELCFRAT
eukprot:CAMPEP_0198656366 /NCGR_PEP_ID=MMETSP1467-20131203/8955_1 /TAXON_ID=1462469 /ORGANISM="unid. sp., Strain CCMP2135" /LENGTH=67 /DNA_ID=CAMNT_0044392387 /DNA_START=41 /DNA_END=240 /DNA_ORIENTATION=-